MANKVLNARVIDFLRVKDFESVLSLIESGVIRASEYLLEQDSGVEFTVLGSAVDVGETDAVRRLLALGADPNINYPGGVPIVNAAGLGHIQILELLLKSGANVNATAASDEECGETALMAAASHKKSLSLVKLLLDYGADPKALDGAGESAMFPATLGGDEHVIRLLIDLGCPITGNCLHKPVSRRDDVIVGEFIAKGVDVNTPFPYSAYCVSKGDTPLMRAVEKSGEEEIAKRLPLEQHPKRAERLSIIDRLIAAGADISVKWPCLGRSLLLKAVEDRDLEIVKRLVRAGADPRAEDQVGNRKISPLYLAERRGEPQMIDALKKQWPKFPKLEV